jgi:hypothetical protein
MRQSSHERLDPLLVSEQQEARLGKSLSCDIGAFDNHARGVVPAHGIKGNGDAVRHR